MRIKFADHIDLLGSREGGIKAKQEFGSLLEQASSTDPVVFDFSDVDVISSSFADEFFGKQISEMGFANFKSITTFHNVNPFLSNVIKNSIYHRNADEFALEN